MPLQEVMNKPEHFEIQNDHAVFRLTGDFPLEKGVPLVTSAIAFAREHDIRKLLVVITGATGFESPTLGVRYFILRDWANAAQGKVCVALVSGPEMIDPQKLEATVAENWGFCGNVFESEEKALAWLKSVGCIGQDGKIRFI